VDRALRLDEARTGVLAVRLDRLDDPVLGDQTAALLGDLRQRLLAGAAPLGLVPPGPSGEPADEARAPAAPARERRGPVSESVPAEHAHRAIRGASRGIPPKVAGRGVGGRDARSPRTDPVRGDRADAEAIRPSRRPWRR